jgi:hypothetical protein
VATRYPRLDPGHLAPRAWSDPLVPSSRPMHAISSSPPTRLVGQFVGSIDGLVSGEFIRRIRGGLDGAFEQRAGSPPCPLVGRSRAIWAVGGTEPRPSQSMIATPGLTSDRLPRAHSDYWAVEVTSSCTGVVHCVILGYLVVG